MSVNLNLGPSNFLSVNSLSNGGNPQKFVNQDEIRDIPIPTDEELFPKKVDASQSEVPYHIGKALLDDFLNVTGIKRTNDQSLRLGNWREDNRAAAKELANILKKLPSLLAKFDRSKIVQLFQVLLLNHVEIDDGLFNLMKKLLTPHKQFMHHVFMNLFNVDTPEVRLFFDNVRVNQLRGLIEPFIEKYLQNFSVMFFVELMTNEKYKMKIMYFFQCCYRQLSKQEKLQENITKAFQSLNPTAINGLRFYLIDFGVFFMELGYCFVDILSKEQIQAMQMPGQDYAGEYRLLFFKKLCEAKFIPHLSSAQIQAIDFTLIQEFGDNSLYQKEKLELLAHFLEEYQKCSKKQKTCLEKNFGDDAEKWAKTRQKENIVKNARTAV